MARPRFPIAAALTVVTVLAAEAGLRLYNFGVDALLHPARYSALPFGRSELRLDHPDPRIGWQLRPAYRGYFKGAPFSTNGYGMRDREIEPRPPECGARIAIFGASQTMGSGVGDEQVFSRRLQSMLDAEPRSAKIEILNFAVTGYAVPQMIADYEERVRDLAPDIVLFRGRIGIARRSEPVLARPQDPARAIEPFAVFDRLPHFFSVMALRDTLRMASLGWLSEDWNTRDKPEPAMEEIRVLAALARFARARRAEGVQVGLMLIPKLQELTRNRREPEPALERWATRHGVILINTYPELKETLDPDDNIYFGDAHPNARAHDAIARALLPEVRKLAEMVARSKCAPPK